MPASWEGNPPSVPLNKGMEVGLCVRSVDGFYLGHVYRVEATLRGAVPSVQDAAVHKVGGRHFRAEELAAVEREECLAEADGTGVQGHGGESGLGGLVGVASGAGAAQLERLTVCFAIEGKREAAGGLDERMGVALGAHEDEGHGPVPQPAYAAPGGGHGVEA